MTKGIKVYPETSLALRCGKCKRDIENDIPEIGWGNAIVYLTSDWELTYKHDTAWVRPTDVPSRQYILCHRCTGMAVQFIDAPAPKIWKK